MNMHVAHYEPGPNWRPGKPICDQPLDEHVKYLRRLHDVGLVMMAGPFEDSSGGLVVFTADRIDAVRSLVSKDPAIEEGTLVAKVSAWLRMV